jgi:enoyl-CoA hydratase/carnithine racemase
MLSLAHDFRVMRADRGFWCLPEADIGIPFTRGMSALIQARLAPQTAHEAMVTGRRYTGEQALAAGNAEAAIDAWLAESGEHAAAERFDAALDASRRAPPLLTARLFQVLALAQLGRAEDAAAGRDAKQVGAAARSLRLNAIDVDAEARRAGLDVCGQERTGLAAADAIVTPAYAQRLADAHAYYVGALAALRRRYLLSGRPLGRFRYWQGVELLTDRVARRLESEAPTRLEDQIVAHFEEIEQLREQAEWLVSTVTGEPAVQDDPVTIPQARRQVEKVRRSGFALLKATGPPGEELIGAVRNAARR